MSRLSHCTAALLVSLGGCGSDELDLVDSAVTSTDPAARKIVSTLAQHGVEVAPLKVQHAGPDGTLYRFDVNAAEAVATWERLRPLVDEIGHYPIVCRDEHGSLAELPEFNAVRPADALRVAAEIEGAKWFAKRVAEEPDFYNEVDQGEWVDAEPQSGWVVPFDILTRKPAAGVFIVLVPTTDPWNALAYLHYGGWNECPAAEEHVAVHRYWHERFGAEVVCLSGDIVEMRVARPPTDRDAALALAREQFIYSGGDLVYQGYESLARLAAALVDARYWYFWWD